MRRILSGYLAALLPVMVCPVVAEETQAKDTPIQDNNRVPATVKPPDESHTVVPATVTAPALEGVSAPSANTVPAVGDVRVPTAIPAPTVDDVSAPSGVGQKALTIPLLLASMHEGALTPKEAWKSGELTLDDLFSILQENVSIWGTVENKDNVELRRALVKLLIEQGGERLKELHKVPSRLRLWMADYYQSIGDIKTVAVAESLLQEFRTPLHSKDDKDISFQVVERLAWYYRDKGDLQKSAETWLRTETLLQEPGWWLSDAVWQAGRMYLWIGNKAKSDDLFAKVNAGEESFFRGMVSYDRATFLLAEGQATQARDLLLHDLKTLREPADRVGPLWTLAQAHWQLEDWSQTEAVLREMLKQVAVQHRVEGMGMPEIRQAAEGRLQTIEEWKNKVFELPLSNAVAKRDDNGVYHARLYVHSWKKDPVQVHIEDNSVEQVTLTQQSQKRTVSGVVVSVYNLSYRTASHPHTLKAQVFTSSAPRMTKPFTLQVGSVNGN